jgi:DNA-directed RNA polymerase specialized sigma24 family protein
METRKPIILSKQMMRYEGMTSAQLLSAILLCNNESTVALWYFLSVRLHDKLQLCYNQCSDDVHVDAFKTFDDYLSDFFIYLYEGHPDYVAGPTQFHYLQTITDNTKVDAWMQHSFKQFIGNERRALMKLYKALPAYLQEQKYQHLNEPQVELTRIAFSLAWYNQFGSIEDRYIFFRSMKKKVTKSFNLSDELSDEETAQALGMKYTTFRSRVSRCCKEVQRLMTEMNRDEIAKLDANNLLLVDSICRVNEDTLDGIVDSLVTAAERQLPQYDNLLEARIKKQEEQQRIVLEDACYRELEYGSKFELEKPIRESKRSFHIPKFEIPFAKKMARSIEEAQQARKKSFIENFVSSFKSFIQQ